MTAVTNTTSDMPLNRTDAKVSNTTCRHKQLAVLSMQSSNSPSLWWCMQCQLAYLLLSCSAVTPVAWVRICAFGMDHTAAPLCCCGPEGTLLWQWMKPSDQPDSTNSGDAATLSADMPGVATRHSSPSICRRDRQDSVSWPLWRLALSWYMLSSKPRTNTWHNIQCL